MASRKKPTKLTTRGPAQSRNRLFHGTTADLTDEVLAPQLSGRSRVNFRSASMGDNRPSELDPYRVASATESERTAWDFADMTAKKQIGRSTVYRVSRTAEMQMGAEHWRHPLKAPGANNSEWVAPRLPIIGREDIRPPDRWERQGRQGTLPMDFRGLPQHFPASKWSPASTYALQDSNGNHPSMVAQNQERERVRMQEKRRGEAEVEAGQLGRSKQKARQMLLPGMRGMGRA